MKELSIDTYKELVRVKRNPVDYPDGGIDNLDEKHKTLLKYDYIALGKNARFHITEDGKSYIYLRKRAFCFDIAGVLFSIVAIVISLISLFKHNAN